MSKFKVIFLLTILGLSLTLFQNCSSGFESNDSATSLSFCKVQGMKQSPFVSSKVAIKKTVFSANQKMSMDNTSMKYSLIVNARCLGELSEPLKFLDQDIVIRESLALSEKVATDIKLPDTTSLEELEKELGKSECLIAIAENQEVRTAQLVPEAVNDPEARQQAHLIYLGHSTSRGLQINITAPVVVAFVDSGIDLDHSEIQSRLWKDGNGNSGKNIIEDNNNIDDIDGHGTHVAGIVAAVENNGEGVAGLTGSYVQIMAVKVLERGAGSSANVATGIRYAVDNGADIINLSIESQGQNPQIEDAIRYAVNAGVFVTAAAGNQAQQITNSNLYAPAYLGPQLNGVMSVASIDITDSLLSVFSNYGSDFIEIAAPGAETSSRSTNDGGILSLNLDGDLTRIQGTSQATPMIAAAAAMVIGFLKTHDIPYTPAGVESFIKSDGAMIHSGISSKVSNGRILQLGFLAENLNQYLLENPNPDFKGEVSTGNLCRL